MEFNSHELTMAFDENHLTCVDPLIDIIEGYKNY